MAIPLVLPSLSTSAIPTALLALPVVGGVRLIWASTLPALEVVELAVVLEPAAARDAVRQAAESIGAGRMGRVGVTSD